MRYWYGVSSQTYISRKVIHMDTLFVMEMEAVFRSEVNLASHDLGILERAVQDRLRSWGRELLHRLVDHASQQESSAPLGAHSTAA
jgi:hypothetical protein